MNIFHRLNLARWLRARASAHDLAERAARLFDLWKRTQLGNPSEIVFEAPVGSMWHAPAEHLVESGRAVRDVLPGCYRIKSEDMTRAEWEGKGEGSGDAK